MPLSAQRAPPAEYAPRKPQDTVLHRLVRDLRQRVEAFIHCFNAVLVKHYKWTDTWRPLVA